MKQTFEAMMKHMMWADRRIGEALAACADGAPDGGRGEPRPAGVRVESAASLAEAVRLYAHVVAAETIWISRLHGEAGLAVPVFPGWDVAATRAKSEETLAKYERFLNECADFNRIVNYRTGSGDAYDTSVADILTHVFLHGSHHRGQINARMRDAGLEPTNVDYITFVRR